MRRHGGANGEGGGLFIRQNVNGTVMIHSSTISNNTSESRAGGIKLESQGTLNATIDQGTVITGNTSLGTGDGISEGGGLDISIIVPARPRLTDVTITNNHANGESGNPSDPGTGGGIFNNLGTLNVSLSRITGNSAPTGSGLFQCCGHGHGGEQLVGLRRVSGCRCCDTVSGTADVDPRLDLVVTATPSTINSGGTSSVKADLSTNSAGTAVNPVVLNGLTIYFGANNGDHDSPFGPARGLDGHEHLYQHELSRPGHSHGTPGQWYRRPPLSPSPARRRRRPLPTADDNHNLAADDDHYRAAADDRRPADDDYHYLAAADDNHHYLAAACVV